MRYAREAERDVDGLDPAVPPRVLIATGKLAADPRAVPNVRPLQGPIATGCASATGV